MWNPFKKKKEEIDIIKILIEYIEEAKRLGYTDDWIKNKFRNKNYKEELINIVFKLVELKGGYNMKDKKKAIEDEEYEEDSDEEVEEPEEETEEEEEKPTKKTFKKIEPKVEGKEVGAIEGVYNMTGYRVFKGYENKEEVWTPCESLAQAEILSYIYKG